jgi:predicted negative regulator of RcsB-dependent stress response
MAEDYLTDDEQLEAVKRIFVEYAPWIVAGLVIGVGGFYGYQYYKSHQNDRAMQAAAQFGQMAMALQLNDQKKSQQIADGLVKDFPDSPYADQAQLAIARIDVENGRSADAVAPLSEVMSKSKDSELRQIARLRLARVMIDQGRPDEAITLLGEGTPGSFAGRYHEVHGDALHAKKDIPGAIKEYSAALGAGDAGADSAMVELKLADLASNDKAKP